MGTVGCRLVGRGGRLVSAGVRVTGRRARAWSSGVEHDREPSTATWVRETMINTFACAALARSVYDAAGPLDRDWYPIGYNDVEYCLRLRRAGLRHVYLGPLACEHEPHGSRPRTDELPQLLELWRRHPELISLGDRQLSIVDEPRAVDAPTPPPRADGLRAVVGRALRRRFRAS